MASTEKEIQLLQRLFEDLLDPNNPKRPQVGLSDIFVRIDTERGEVALYGDDDELINAVVLFSWVASEESAPSSTMISQLREAISRLESRGFWEHDLFEHPFSIELVGEDFETIEELLFLDDDLVKVSTPLLEGLHEDLDNFLGNLLSDLK